MDIRPHCLNCGAGAVLLCVCQHSQLCQSCIPLHLAQNPMEMHTFLPSHYESLLQEGVDDLSVVCRGQLDKGYKALLKGEIDSLENFKLRSLASLQAKADSLTEALNSYVMQKIEELERDVAIAKEEGTTFISNTLRKTSDLTAYDATVLFKNIMTHNTDLKQLQTFKRTVEFSECEAAIQSFAGHSIQCPTDQLFMLTRTPEEYRDWLLVVRKRKKKERRRLERCFHRLTPGSERSWIVGGPPTLEAISLRANCDILLTGIGTGNGYAVGGGCTIVDLEVRQGLGTQGTLLYRHPETVTSSYNGRVGNKFFKVRFAWPVQLLKDTDYTIRVAYASGENIYSANGDRIHSIDEVTFTFTKSRFEGGDRDNSSSPDVGPVRDIYFAMDLSSRVIQEGP